MTADIEKLKEISIPAYSLWKNSRKPSDDLYPANDMANHIVEQLLALAQENKRLKKPKKGRGCTHTTESNPGVKRQGKTWG